MKKLIEKNSNTVVIHEEYYSKESDDEEVKYRTTDGVSFFNKKKTSIINIYLKK